MEIQYNSVCPTSDNCTGYLVGCPTKQETIDRMREHYNKRHATDLPIEFRVVEIRIMHPTNPSLRTMTPFAQERYQYLNGQISLIE